MLHRLALCKLGRYMLRRCLCPVEAFTGKPCRRPASCSCLPLLGRFLLGMDGRRHLGKAVGVGQAAVQVCGEEGASDETSAAITRGVQQRPPLPARVRSPILSPSFCRRRRRLLAVLDPAFDKTQVTLARSP